MSKKSSTPFSAIITGDGLPAHQVARRCVTLESADDRELIWFLQEISMRSGRNAHHQCDKLQSWPWETPGFVGGGLDRIAADLIHRYPGLIGSPTMCKLKKKNGDYYADEVKALRREIPNIKASDYRVKGEVVMEIWERDMTLADSRRRANLYPECYPVKAFVDLVEGALRGLPQYLRSLCLNPAIDMDRAGVWYITGLLDILRKYKQAFEAAVRDKIVSTDISRSVQQTLELAISSRGMVVIEGPPRVGKSIVAQSWCQQRLGSVRYLQLESSSDEISFFRSISQALGTPCNPELKAYELRAYIKEVLSVGDLLLVVDEADHLWPRTIRPLKAPARIEWINTALKNKGIPLAMVGTTKFTACIELFDKKCSVWASEQFKGRLAEHNRLPSELPDEDLRSIVLHLLPEASNGMISLLVGLAKKDEGYVATIERAVQRSRFIAAQRASGSVTPEILMEVFQDIVGQGPPVKQSPTGPSTSRENHSCSGGAVPVQTHGRNRARQSSVSQSHVLGTLTNRLNSDPLVTS